MSTMLLLLVLIQSNQLGTNQVGTGIVRGRAYSLNTGLPMKQVQVQLAAKGMKTNRTMTTGRDGVFEFTALSPGTYTVQCAKRGYLGAGYGSKGPDQPPS